MRCYLATISKLLIIIKKKNVPKINEKIELELFQ